MSLTKQQQELFKERFSSLVSSFATELGITIERAYLDVIPLAVQIGTDHLIQAEVDLKKRLSESKKKTMKIQNSLKQETVEEKSKEQKKKSLEDYHELGKMMGKTVVRGKDWKWDNQDGGAGNTGKVIGVKFTGWVKVKWLANRSENRYRWGVDNCYDLEIVDETVDTFVPDYEEQMTKKETWTIGKHVVRGRDWKWKEQDGGEGHVGLVLDVCDDGWVEVKWEDDSIGQYRWGFEGCYDLKVIPKPEEK